MVAALENKREAIVALCRKYGVVRMDVFGSAVRDDFRPGESDVDLLVDFGSMDPFGLVDLVMSDAIKNRSIVAKVERTRQTLYGS